MGVSAEMGNGQTMPCALIKSTGIDPGVGALPILISSELRSLQTDSAHSMRQAALREILPSYSKLDNVLPMNSLRG